MASQIPENNFPSSASTERIQNNQALTQNEQTHSIDQIKKELGKLADVICRAGITLTGILPFSSRGILVNLVLAPFRLPFQLIDSALAGPGFKEKMKGHITHNWNQGIKDFYINLESKNKKELRQDVVKQNFCYAAYIYAGLSGRKAGGEKGVLIRPDVSNFSIPTESQQIIEEFQNKLEGMGFKIDPKGNFYNTQTGTMLNLIYDIDKKEFIVSFFGFGNEAKLTLDPQENPTVDNTKDILKKIHENSLKAVLGDWFGGIPDSSLEAIMIGKLLKESTHNTDVTPVMIGHSHGGGLAQTGAVANGIKGIVFNSRPMGAGIRRYIGQAVIADNAKNITAFSGKGDWLSGTVVVNGLAAFFERVTGIPVPRTVGTGYHLPDLPLISGSHFDNKLQNHFGFYNAFDNLRKMDE